MGEWSKAFYEFCYLYSCQCNSWISSFINLSHLSSMVSGKKYHFCAKFSRSMIFVMFQGFCDQMRSKMLFCILSL